MIYSFFNKINKIMNKNEWLCEIINPLLLVLLRTGFLTWGEENINVKSKK